MWDYKNKTFSLVVGNALMTDTESNKALVSAWKWITPEEKAQNVSEIAVIQKRVDDEISAMEIKSPWLIKAAAYEPAKIAWMIESWLWRFWEQQKMWFILRAMSNANKALIKESYKQLNWKDRYKKNSKTMEFKIKVEKENAVFDRMLLGKTYNTILQWNQTMAQTLQLLYTNTSPDSPLKNPLTTYSSLGTFINLSMIEKNVASQGISSMWINNPIAERTSRIRWWFNWLSPEDKEKKLPWVLWWINWSVDDINSYSDPLKAKNAKIWMATSNIDHLIELSKDPELMIKVAPSIKDYIDRVTVSEPITDDVLMQDIRDVIFKVPWAWAKKHRRQIAFNKLNFKLNKFSDFKTDFVRYVLKEEPLEHITYKVQWATILPLRESAMEARPPKPEYDFVKIAKAGKVVTPDIKIETIKTTKASKVYTWKAIKWQNIYVIKTSKWRKK